VIARRWRGRVAEVDLIVRRRDEDALVEVKTVSAQSAFHSSRLTARQLGRLLRARELWQAKSARPTRLLLAWVTPTGEILLFNLPEGGLE
jgi:Holliday junction resolvase-like predicted endonuclease